jgi:hypothetical protein
VFGCEIPEPSNPLPEGEDDGAREGLVAFARCISSAAYDLRT